MFANPVFITPGRFTFQFLACHIIEFDILHGKISGLGEIRAWKFGVLIFGPRIFLVSLGIRQVCDGL